MTDVVKVIVTVVLGESVALEVAEVDNDVVGEVPSPVQFTNVPAIWSCNILFKSTPLLSRGHESL